MCERKSIGAKTEVEGGEKQLPERQTNYTDPVWQTGRHDHIRVKDTFSQSSTDLEEALRCAMGSAFRSYDSPAREDLLYSRSGVRGKYDLKTAFITEHSVLKAKPFIYTMEENPPSCTQKFH